MKRVLFSFGVSAALLVTSSLKAENAAAPSDCCAKKGAATSSCGHAEGADGCSNHTPLYVAPTGSKRKLTAELKPVFDRYLEIQKELANDSDKRVTELSGALASAMRNSGSGCLSGSAGTADSVGKAKDLKAARVEFAKLSDIVLQFVAIANIEGYHGFYCSMAKAGWVQGDESMRNPYMGASMLECGKKVL